ncbi:MAG: mechanosensitive ion channel domain-containing protein [Myxococcota bacterium]
MKRGHTQPPDDASSEVFELLGQPLRGVETLLDVPLFDIGQTHVTAMTLVTVGFVFVATFWASRVIRAAVRRAFQLRDVDPRTVGVVNNLINYVVLLAGLGVALDTIGLDLGALFAAGAVFAVGIGLALQNVVQNFVSGVLLLVERSIKPHDILEVDGEVLRVERIGIRSTVALSRTGQFFLIPNNDLVQNRVKNLTFESTDVIRVEAAVGVAYESDMKQVHDVLLRVAQAAHEPDTGEAARVYLTEFGDSSVNWLVTAWTHDPWEAPDFTSQLYRRIWDALAEAGITIAFPQLDVHFDPQDRPS